MTIFKRLIVQNYKSIEYASIDFLSGIYKVIGDNQDTTYTSNGAGKSSVLQAIVLGLYNKDFTSAPLDTLSNRFTGKPYLITVDFSTTIDGVVKDVTITNPGGAARMRAYVNEDLVATGSITVVPLVEKWLGMGYSTFKITHFITSNTITNLVQNLSQPTLFNDILHIVELQELDKKLQQAGKVISSELEELKAKVQVMEQQSKLLEFKAKYDLTTIERDITILEGEVESTDSKYTEMHKEISSAKYKASVEVSKLQQLIDQTRSTLREGICGMCGHILVDRSTLQTLNKNLEGYVADVLVAQKTLDEVSDKQKILNKKYNEQRQDLLNNLSMLGQDLNIAKEISTLEVFEADHEILSKVEDLEEQSLFIATARKEIKSGKVIKSVLDQFFGIISIKLQEYSELIRLDHFDITIANDKLGMAILLEQAGVQVPIESLSNGEKTRLSLLILISMLDAMKIVSDSETNLVILDEAASSFDKSGIEELSKLFAHLRNLGQAIFIITHGSEMDQVEYNYQLTITKNSGTATSVVTEI